MDAVVAPQKHVNLFADDVGQKPVLFDPWTGIRDYKGKRVRELAAFEKERILRGTVADMSETLSKDKEKFMGLLFVGRFLEGKPRTSAMKRIHREFF